MAPPVNPPAEIDDPSDSKPADWVRCCVAAPPPPLSSCLVLSCLVFPRHSHPASHPASQPASQPLTRPAPSLSLPNNQVDEATIPDPDAVKPPEWDEDAPAQVPDMDATKVCPLSLTPSLPY